MKNTKIRLHKNIPLYGINYACITIQMKVFTVIEVINKRKVGLVVTDNVIFVRNV